MKLFCFASRSDTNIQIGIENQLWAVGTLLNQQSMKTRATKAGKNLSPGDCGLLYSNQSHSFTTPFLVVSYADPASIVDDVWPESWCLPFKIKTLGNLSRRLHADIAKERWRITKRCMIGLKGGGISAAMNITGTTVFVPLHITSVEWDEILADLATN